jgi:3',5'-cyclic AMP phosphodiesterase CpdA
VVISGDLTDTGSERELDCLERLLRGRGLEGRAVLVPGNHDTGSNMYCLLNPGQRHRPRRQRAERLLALAKAYLPKAQPLGPGGGWPLRLGQAQGRVVLFALDSSGGHGGAPWFSRGRLGRRQLAALQGGLEALEPWQSAVLVLHHHALPMPVGRRPQEIAYLDGVMALGDRARLQELIVSHRVRLVLHGHRHYCFQQMLGRAKVVQAASPAQGCSLSGRRNFNLISLGLKSRRVRVDRVDFAPPAQLRLLSKVSYQQDEWQAWLGALGWARGAAGAQRGLAHGLEGHRRWPALDGGMGGSLDHALLEMLDRARGQVDGSWRKGGADDERE